MGGERRGVAPRQTVAPPRLSRLCPADVPLEDLALLVACRQVKEVEAQVELFECLVDRLHHGVIKSLRIVIEPAEAGSPRRRSGRC